MHEEVGADLSKHGPVTPPTVGMATNRSRSHQHKLECRPAPHCGHNTAVVGRECGVGLQWLGEHGLGSRLEACRGNQGGRRWCGGVVVLQCHTSKG